MNKSMKKSFSSSHFSLAHNGEETIKKKFMANHLEKSLQFVGLIFVCYACPFIDFHPLFMLTSIFFSPLFFRLIFD